MHVLSYCITTERNISNSRIVSASIQAYASTQMLYPNHSDSQFLPIPGFKRSRVAKSTLYFFSMASHPSPDATLCHFLQGLAAPDWVGPGGGTPPPDVGEGVEVALDTGAGPLTQYA